MAFLTLGTLLNVTTRAQALTNLIAVLDSVGFNATSWQSGSVQRNFLEMGASLWADVTTLSSSLTSFQILDQSVGAALTAYSDSQYDNQRFTATNTVGQILHTVAAGSGPYTVAIGDLVVQDTVNGFTYRNTTGDTITSALPVALAYQAEEVGAAKNVANGSIVTLNTPLAGVTVSNPAQGGPPATTWITTLAIDSETDPNIRIRDRTKWATLTITEPADAYNNIVRNSSAAITRSTVDGNNPRGAGTVDIYIAGAAGASSAANQVTAQTAVDLRRPVTADPDVVLPTPVGIVPAATVFITTALDTVAERVAIEQAVLDYINSQPIGGTAFGGGGIIPFSVLSQTVTDFTSVQNVTWTTPTADIALAPTELSVPSFPNPLGTNFTFTPS